jgi:succinyl-CoA synthetase beta subunit
MSKYGVNVPPGIPVFKVDEVEEAAKNMASPDGEVGSLLLTRLPCGNA